MSVGLVHLHQSSQIWFANTYLGHSFIRKHQRVKIIQTSLVCARLNIVLTRVYQVEVFFYPFEGPFLQFLEPHDLLLLGFVIMLQGGKTNKTGCDQGLVSLTFTSRMKNVSILVVISHLNPAVNGCLTCSSLY